MIESGGKVGRLHASLTRCHGEKDVLLHEVREGAADVNPMCVALSGGSSGFDIGSMLEATLKGLEVIEQGDGKGVSADYTLGMLCHVQAHVK